MSARYLVVFAAQSQRDVRTLRRNLERKAGARIADRYVDAVLNFCFSLGSAPHRGETRAFLPQDVRVVGYKRRVAIYFRVSVKDEIVVVARILYAGKMS